MPIDTRTPTSLVLRRALQPIRMTKMRREATQKRWTWSEHVEIECYDTGAQTVQQAEFVIIRRA